MGPHKMKTAQSSLGDRVGYLQRGRVGEDLQVSLWIQYTCMQTGPHLRELRRKKSCDLVLWVLRAVLDTQRQLRSTTYTIQRSAYELLTKMPHCSSSLSTLLLPAQAGFPGFLLLYSGPSPWAFSLKTSAWPPSISLQVHAASSGIPSLFCIKGSTGVLENDGSLLNTAGK